MSDTAIEPVSEPQPMEKWKIITLVSGGVLGALVGVGAGYLLVQQADRRGEKVQITVGDSVKLGLLVLGLLRSIANLYE